MPRRDTVTINRKIYDRALTEKGLTNLEVSAKLNVPYSTYCRWLAQGYPLNMGKPLAKVLDITDDDHYRAMMGVPVERVEGGR